MTSATDTGESSVQRGKFTKMRPRSLTVTPVTWCSNWAACCSTVSARRCCGWAMPGVSAACACAGAAPGARPAPANASAIKMGVMRMMLPFRKQRLAPHGPPAF
jgi:hypothetical protein